MPFQDKSSYSGKAEQECRMRGLKCVVKNQLRRVSSQERCQCELQNEQIERLNSCRGAIECCEAFRVRSRLAQQVTSFAQRQHFLRGRSQIRSSPRTLSVLLLDLSTLPEIKAAFGNGGNQASGGGRQPCGSTAAKTTESPQHRGNRPSTWRCCSR